MKLYAEVVVSTGTRMTDRRFSYLVPDRLKEEIREGMSVFVPFGRGNRKTPGLVLKLLEAEDFDFEVKELLDIASNQMTLSRESLMIAEYMIDRNLSDYSSALSTVLPPGSFEEVKPLMRSRYGVSEEGRRAEPDKRAHKQREILDYLVSKGPTERAALLKATGASGTSLDSLLEKGWVVREEYRHFRRELPEVEGYRKKSLNPKQAEIFQAILQKPDSYLICGVTGSGKTEIYLQLVEDALKKGREAIVLVPEISLTPQTIDRFQGRFGDQVAILHSRLSRAERYEEWEKIYHGQVSIAIGARSAIFAPFRHLGVIIIDEEHEQSYISEKNPKYRTYEIAELRRRYHGCSLILGTATPSIETLYRVEEGACKRFDLYERANGQPLPPMEVIDMREELKENNRSMFSRSLYRAMTEALDRKEQVILFLNKRGHTSYVFCRKCGYVYRCDACDVAMTYHKHRNRLICHYCGREKDYRSACPACGSTAIKEFGAGTELLEEVLRKLFPDKRIVRADADTMRAKGAYHRVYHGMLNGDIDILVGTQMIAKGFDFPRLTVVGIVAADISLNLPDLRACERTFQLITQVAGRAGRGNLPGRVFIQTYKPDHYAIQTAVRHDVDGFYELELAMRREKNYPPISQELHIGIQGEDRPGCISRGRKIRSYLDRFFKNYEGFVRLEGPTPSVIERINQKYRFAVIIRCLDKDLLVNLGKDLISRFPTRKEMNIIVSLNPTHIY